MKAESPTAIEAVDPSQVEAVNTGFAPSADELAWAREVLEASSAGGRGALTVRGKLVDQPVVERARRLRALSLQ